MDTSTPLIFIEVSPGFGTAAQVDSTMAVVLPRGVSDHVWKIEEIVALLDAA
jgi:hypothetical protein